MRLAGHPLHPMMVHFPIALWSLATACDGLTLFGVGQAWPIAWLCTIAGLAFAIPAMVAGMIDFASIKEEAVPMAMRHMGIMGTAWLVYLASLLMRSDGLASLAAPVPLAMAAGLVGFLLLAAGAWHGGQLVYRLGVGVEAPSGPDVGPNAPN